MRNIYNSFNYWQDIVNDNRKVRGQMFVNDTITEETVYFHSLIYCKNNGLSNVWTYFPNEMALLGYLQYSFLQESFYKWINYKDQKGTYIPNIKVLEIIDDGEKRNKINKDIANKMRKQLEELKKIWDVPKNKALIEINKFIREFNITWYGDHTEFIYMKAFKNAEDLGEFVLKSNYMTSSEEDFINKTKNTIDRWKSICTNVTKNKEDEKIFKEVLIRNLTEVI